MLSLWLLRPPRPALRLYKTGRSRSRYSTPGGTPCSQLLLWSAPLCLLESASTVVMVAWLRRTMLPKSTAATCIVLTRKSLLLVTITWKVLAAMASALLRSVLLLLLKTSILLLIVVSLSVSKSSTVVGLLKAAARSYICILLLRISSSTPRSASTATVCAASRPRHCVHTPVNSFLKRLTFYNSDWPSA